MVVKNMMLCRHVSKFLLFLAIPVRAFSPIQRSNFILITTSVSSSTCDVSSRYSASSLDDEFTSTENDKASSSSTEFAALIPGRSELEIQVGNLDLARKAWKKRRRSGSPLLVPCSILSTDRMAMVLNNLVYLLHRFGRPISELNLPNDRPNGYKSNHIGIPGPDLSRFYKSHLKTPLSKHARSLGFENPAELVNAIFAPEVQEDYGVELLSVNDDDGKTRTWLLTKMTQMKGHRLAAQAAMLQFQDHDVSTAIMKHTGMTRDKKKDAPPDYKSTSYELSPLSAALRLGQRGLVDVVNTGSEHTAVLVGVDPMGDGGLPLLKVALSSTITNSEMTRKRARSSAPDGVVPDGLPLKLKLNELKAGDGPFMGTIVRVSRPSGAAFVDIGVGRNAGEGGAMTRVLGMLRFDDLMKAPVPAQMEEDEENEMENMLDSMEYDDDDEREVDVFNDDMLSDLALDDLFNEDDDYDDMEEGEEIEEDISHLVSLDDNNVFTYTDPETGEQIVMGNLNEEDNPILDEAEEEDDFFAGLSPEERFERLGEIMSDEQPEGEGFSTLQVGQDIEVYIQAVSKQSGRFMLTIHALVNSMKEMKKETKASKSLARLLASFGGDMKNVMKLEGREGEGTVKAISQTGDWMYVQPNFQDLPVGVAQLSAALDLASFAPGDVVKIRLDGLDESRGQLAMTVVAKN